MAQKEREREREQVYSSTISLTPTLQVVDGQRHAPVIFRSGKILGFHFP
jgi:hypothetical protein